MPTQSEAGVGVEGRLLLVLCVFSQDRSERVLTLMRKNHQGKGVTGGGGNPGDKCRDWLWGAASSTGCDTSRREGGSRS